MRLPLALILVSIACFSAVSGRVEASTCRSPAVKHQFDRMNGYPHGRKGYIVDHVCALANGGLDSVKNMQYQTTADSKAKDRIENTPAGKRKWCNKTNSTPTRQVFNCR